MKKSSFLLILLLILSTSVFAQTNTFPPNGRVGIGTTLPAFQLDIVVPQLIGDSENLLRLRVSDAPNDHLSFQNATGANNTFIPYMKGFFSSHNGPALFVGGEIISANDNGNFPVVIFDARASNSSIVNRNPFSWRNFTNELMVLNPSGNLGIGTSTPTHKLEVNGTIKTKEVNVTLTGWPDYVFAPEYNLISLDSLSEFIQVNRHLPDVPTEKSVVENGVNIGEMNAILLKKIEELTLYLLKQEEDLKLLKNSNESIKEELSKLSAISKNKK